MTSVRNIAYLLPYSELAGGERVMLDLCSGLDKNRFRPYVVLPRDGGLAKKFRASGISVDIIPFCRDFIAGFPPAFNLSSIGKISHVLSERNIHLLHLNDSYLTLMGGIIGQKLRVPVTLTAHGVWDAHFIFQDLLNRFFLRKIWVPTDAIGRALQRRGIIPPDRIRKIYFSVDTEKFSPRASQPLRKIIGIPTNAVVVLRVARFDAVKDYPTFLLAAERLAPKYGNLHFLVLGDTLLGIASEAGGHKRNFLSFLEQRPDLKKRVHYMGHQDDIASYIEAADILISSSLSESFGLNLLEAMSMGKPVVSTNTGGPSEIVVDGITGRLVSPRDPVALADAVAELIEQPEKGKRMGEEGRKRVQALFNLDRFVELMQQEYAQVLNHS